MAATERQVQQAAPALGAGSSPRRSTTPGPRVPILHRLLPWLSLIVGVVSGALMNRTPERGPWVAGGAVALWLTLTLRIALSPIAERHSLTPGRRPPRLLRWLHVSALVATQSLMQLSLFFALPFYVEAAVWSDPGHLLFMGLLLTLAGISLWDPWTARLLGGPMTGHVLPTLSTFVGLAAVLPGLGVSNRQSLWTAAAAAGVGALSAGIVWHQGQPGPRRAVGALAAAAVVPVFLVVGGARLLPAAPIKLVSAAFGSQRAEHWVADETRRFPQAPPELICATAIYAPLGIHETLWHVWRHHGSVYQRLSLDITGGRKAGYRTRSRLRNPGRAGPGTWTCTVETDMGQLVGRARASVGGALR